MSDYDDYVQFDFWSMLTRAEQNRQVISNIIKQLKEKGLWQE
jgi:hypothetical protein